MINIVNASSFIHNIDNNRSLSFTSFDNNYKKEFDNNYNNEKQSNINSTSQSSITSTDSNTSNGSQGFIIKSESQDSINEIFSNSIETNITIENDPNTIFQKNCIIPNLDLNTGKKYLLTLYSEFEELNSTAISNTHISKINDKFCLMTNIAYGIIMANKILQLNNNISDEDIENINDISYTAYYENGFFTKEVIMRCFNENKNRWINLLYPLINNNDK
ncbi:MAG: hypothetical protein IJU54_00670 [Alphaproteobacteria bacterium]|nr:hypothetical protein [Alphaproteobacteria bacterium]